MEWCRRRAVCSLAFPAPGSTAGEGPCFVRPLARALAPGQLLPWLLFLVSFRYLANARSASPCTSRRKTASHKTPGQKRHPGPRQLAEQRTAQPQGGPKQQGTALVPAQLVHIVCLPPLFGNALKAADQQRPFRAQQEQIPPATAANRPAKIKQAIVPMFIILPPLPA